MNDHSQTKSCRKREVLPDPSLQQRSLVTKFINGLMWEGKKSIAEQIFYGAMDLIEEKTERRAAEGL